MEANIPKYVINLKRREDRLENFKKHCPFNDVEVVYGFDAKNIANECTYEQGIYNSFKSLMPGERGVFISHLRIYKDIIDKNIPYALIMEDDAVFCNDFIMKYEQVMKDAPSDMNILFVGGRFQENFQMKPENSIHVSDCIIQHKIINCQWTGGADLDRTLHAYVISHLGAKLLVRALDFYNTVDLKPIDMWLLQVFAEHGIKIYNAKPLLCYSPRISDSDIRNTGSVARISRLRPMNSLDSAPVTDRVVKAHRPRISIGMKPNAADLTKRIADHAKTSRIKSSYIAH